MNTVRDALQTICFPVSNRAWRTTWLSIKTLLFSIICTTIAKSTRNSRLVAFCVNGSLIKAFALALPFVACSPAAAAENQLIMVTSDHCPYCQAWELDVGKIYDESPYALSLPLTRVEIGSKIPGGVTLQKPVVGTPTFLIIYKGEEIDRQNGYSDAELFWWWLSEYAAE